MKEEIETYVPTLEQEEEMRLSWNRLSYEISPQEWIECINSDLPTEDVWGFRQGYIIAKYWRKECNSNYTPNFDQEEEIRKQWNEKFDSGIDCLTRKDWEYAQSFNYSRIEEGAAFNYQTGYIAAMLKNGVWKEQG
jgi:hypothetical protein